MPPLRESASPAFSDKTWAVDDRPVTRYVAAPDGVSLAYQVVGGGPLDIVFIPGLALPIDLLWEDPGFAHFARRLGRFSRTVWLEGRGIGASGGDFVASAVEEDISNQNVYGLTSVLDAIGCKRVVLVAHGSAGPFAIRYAASRSERVTTLVLVDSHAYYVREEGYPWGMPPEAIDRHIAVVKEVWGSGAALDALAPSKAGDDRFRAWDSRSQRLGASPEGIAAAVRAGFQRDVRDLLPTLCLPTLIVHREGDRFIRAGAGRYLAEHIADARYVELPGDDHLFFVGDVDALVDEIEEFLTGTHQAPEGDVVTSTIVFTDIVSSTERSARMGHRRWTKLADDHDAMVRTALGRYRGREVKTIGDGFLATFDSTTRAVHAATEIVTGAHTMGLEVRAGVHNGEVEVRPDDVVGLAVTIAKRICDLAGPGAVLVSEAVKLHLVGSGIGVAEHGTHVLKGVPDTWRLFAVEG
ncbi:MAG: alpha/beta fold hydrolase [Acidimicrobiales bacterium]